MQFLGNNKPNLPGTLINFILAKKRPMRSCFMSHKIFRKIKIIFLFFHSSIGVS